MHRYKIHAPVTTSSSEQFVNLTPILTHRYFHKGSSQRFSSKKTCQISNLSKSLIAGNHVYLNCSAFLAPQTDWWVQDMRPHCSSIWKYRNWKFGAKKYRICIFGITKRKMQDNKIHTPVTTWPQEQFFNPAPILTHRCFHKHTSQRFSSKKNLPNFKS